jgi:hypothetical protein
MEIGIAQLLPGFAYDNLTDAQLYNDEIALAIAADELGYDHLWAVEHHFEDYSLCPDNFVYLAHLAAVTKRIKLATGVTILPWNLQPLRVAEKMAMLDVLSKGRAILGLGRGLARREFDTFGIQTLGTTNGQSYGSLGIATPIGYSYTDNNYNAFGIVTGQVSRGYSRNSIGALGWVTTSTWEMMPAPGFDDYGTLTSSQVTGWSGKNGPASITLASTTLAASLFAALDATLALVSSLGPSLLASIGLAPPRTLS